jgi:hypothetical protein
VQGSGCRVHGSGFRVQGSELRFRVERLGVMTHPVVLEPAVTLHARPGTPATSPSAECGSSSLGLMDGNPRRPYALRPNVNTFPARRYCSEHTVTFGSWKVRVRGSGFRGQGSGVGV